MKVENQTPMDLLSALGGMGKTGVGKEFQKLLSTVMNGTDGLSNPSAGKKSQAGNSTDPDDAIMSAAATQMVQGSQQPAAEQSGETVADTVQGDVAVTAVADQAQQTQVTEAAVQDVLDNVVQTGDILSMQASVPVEEADPAVMAQTVYQPLVELETSDKLGDMMGQAQLELAAIVEEIQVEEVDLPDEPLEEIPVLEEEVDTALPEEPETAVDKQPVEDTTEGGTQVKTQPEKPVTEQRPMSEMPQKDRLVMEMRETKKPVERETAEPAAQTAAASEPTEPARPAEVKPAEPEAPRPNQQMDQMEQVRVEVTRNLEQQKMEFRMQLQPEHLGKVDVKMVLESGRLAVEIMAANPKAAELLTKQAEGLMVSLKAQNLDVQSINVVTESQTAQGHMDGAFNMLSGRQDNGEEQGSASGRGGRSDGSDQEAESQEQPVARNPEALLDYVV